ncbi:family 20 glycosylhydrolase [Streptomyces mobaraensis NBRC 13819 = DSM 40847]|uniref:Putative glycosylhydrolase n=1 Tax=Streptomyces mobaraensis (strain ATCC 29032 / DSM 40847 / JCM 4168 / NBRC 13819 / NCIMB 11159 / IPCR 16-22) TaxID=1223523 RepID=M3C7Q5_STRM1|nr:glycoside hydrolase family 20 protein [Streptomyces mobaraensis]EME99995.1 putative glycosylhydrolase [Streptomyces mobaraensis NBRC 13819 = DSM 40847]QTT75352.1 family 20 glycosylhydrolase [Streptomyces mobaraensis NBRC 13819 = DSM 40847]
MGLPVRITRIARVDLFGRRRRVAPRRPYAVLALLAAALALPVAAGCAHDGGAASGSSGRTAGDDDRSTQAAAPSSATRITPVTGTPRTVPAVRSFTARGGPGWRPSSAVRVVTDTDGPLADEARLLAGELKVTIAPGPARAGDVELALRPGQRGGPESYELTTRDGRVLITAPDEAGVFYGTRTLVQSVRSGGGVPEGVIADAPDRPQRGLHLDIARKHFTAEWIEARLREMADLKLNQLGLHFSDDQGFRIESASHPEIVSPEHLTKAEVRRIVALATSLHITVIPEIDSPGHLGAVLKAHPDLQLRDATGTPSRGAVDISLPGAAGIVDDLLREFTPLFPGPYWHLGSDEYRALMARDPQGSYPHLADLARQRYGSQGRVQDLATAWLNDRAAVVRSLGKKAKAWNDGFFRGGLVAPDQAIEVEYWTGRELGARDPQEYLNEGRTVVNLNDQYLYYVLGEPNEFRYPTGELIYKEWSPAVLRGTAPVAAGTADPRRVPGGRFAVWCDHPDAQTPDQVANGIRLPLAAVAQRLWDPRPPKLPWQDFAALYTAVRGG